MESIDTWQATREAITQIQTKGAVLVPAQVAPHLTHRPVVKLAIAGAETTELGEFDYVVLNRRHPGWASSPEVVNYLLERLQNTSTFQLTYQQDEVYLFSQKLIRNSG